MSQEMIDKLKSVEMEVTVRFGLTEMPLRDVASLGSGSMIELNRTVDEPVELLVNDFPFARGEVVVVDGYYSVRITEVSTPDENSSVFLLDSLSNSDSSEEWTPAEAENTPEEMFSDASNEEVIGTPENPESEEPNPEQQAAQSTQNQNPTNEVTQEDVTANSEGTPEPNEGA